MRKKIILLTGNKKENVLFEGNTILDLLRERKINPQTVLIKKNNEFSTEDEIIEKEDVIELVSVVSKG